MNLIMFGCHDGNSSTVHTNRKLETEWVGGWNEIGHAFSAFGCYGPQVPYSIHAWVPLVHPNSIIGFNSNLFILVCVIILILCCN